jgi:hypothetical protein
VLARDAQHPRDPARRGRFADPADEDTGELRFRKTLNREQEMIVTRRCGPARG